MWTINRFLSSLFEGVYAPMASWPAWLSLGIISAVTGIVLLFAYRYTSNQDAIGRARDEIKAHMLSMKLFKDNLTVTFVAQAKVIWASLRILGLSIPPLLVALVPVGALFVQMTGRYQFAPVAPGRSATVCAYLSDDFASRELKGEARLALRVPDGVEVLTPQPWRKHDSTEAQWEVRADQPGFYEVTVMAGDEELTKQLPIGRPDAFTGPISPLRTRYSLLEEIGFPWEKPPPGDSNIRAVEIPEVLRGTMPDVLGVPVLGNWIVYFLVVSMVFALIFKPIFKVRL